MSEVMTEKRFEVAARHLCRRWDSFDFHRRISEGDSADSAEPMQCDEESGGSGFWSYGLAKRLDSEIKDLGAVSAIRRWLHMEEEGDALLDLAASNRFDLTVEFLVLCRAWKCLFDESERRTAAERLLNLLSLSCSAETTPSAAEDLDHILDWLIDRVARCEVDPDLPKSRTSYGWQDQSSRKDQTWCDSIADTAREFSEIGLVATSLTQCSHYLHCPQCIGGFPELERQFRRFETATISQCHELLKLLGVCVERVFRNRHETGGGGLVGHGDEFAWRAIVGGAGLAYNDSISEFSRILNEVERGLLPVPELRQLLVDLDRDELHLLSFVEAVSQPFIEVQWSLYDNDDLVYLPSDGDLWDVPQVVVVLKAPDVSEWKQLMTGSDLAFRKRDRNGCDSTLSIDGIGLFIVFNSAAAFRSEKRVTALAATDQERVQKLGAEGEVRTAERLAAPTPEPADSSVAGSREDSRMQTLLDRVTELCGLVASNSAAQVPIRDTLQSLVNKSDSPSRYRAEESVRREFGDALYDRLSPKARHLAVAAEYCWLDANAPDPSKIVADLATAFEDQLRETVFIRFCEALLTSGIRNYPERPGALPSLVSRSPSERTRPGLPDVPTLLENGRITRTLTLGSMQKLLERPLPALTGFLTQRRIQKLMDVLPEITRLRNRAVHEGQPALREEASQIRCRWLGKTENFPNIFAALMPDGSAGSATGARL